MDVPDFREEEKYNAVARFFHWVIAFFIVFMLGLGLTMEDVNFGVPREYVYDLHKSLGLLILLLAIGRIIWRFASVPPEALDTHARWERILAKIAHLFLYFCLFAMPLSGWLMSDAAGRPPTFFGLPVPRLLSHDDSLRQIFGTVHFYLAWGLILVIGLHVSGALKHHIIDKDATLRRMAGEKLGWLKAVLLFLILDICLMAAAFMIVKEAVPHADTPLPISDANNQAPLLNDEWQIDTANSTIQFESSAFGTKFTGRFDSFDGTIMFDPDNIPMARADISIDMMQIFSGDDERDAMMHTPSWFSTGQFPRSRFVTRTIQHHGADQYVAIGDLTIRDVTMPLSLPFTLTFSEQAGQRIAHMQGNLIVERLDFGVGQGEWQGTEVVPNDVAVTIDLKAIQPQ